MPITRRIGAVFTLSLLIAAQPARAEEEARWPKSPDELAVTLSVQHALEEGPVVCTVTLKNVSKARLKYATSMFEKGAYCAADAGWTARKEPLCEKFLICGNIGPYEQDLYPGNTVSKTFYLHPSFLSIPSGKAAVRFGWRVYRIVDKPAEKDWDRRQLDLLFDLKDAQSVEILPATERNVAATLRNLEADLATVAKRLGPREDYAWCSDDPSAAFVDTIKGCRHKEFVPLLFRAIDQLPAADFRRQLVGVVYESSPTPEEGFSALADYLSSPSPAAADEVIDYWVQEEQAHEESKRRREELQKPLLPEPDPEKALSQKYFREIIEADEEAWKDSKRHPDTRLTKEQFDRLRAVKGVWVRTLLYSYYPDKCPAGWVDALFDDLKQVVRPPERFQKLLTDLDDDSFDVREQATAELIRSGPTFAWYLWAAPLDKLPPEAANRLQRVLEKVEKPELPPLWRRAISHFGWYPTPQNQRLLDALTSSDCPSLVSRAAQEAIKEAKKRQADDDARKIETDKPGGK